jgi:hypothetical protein
MIEFEFVTASHDKSVLSINLLKSPRIRTHGISIQNGFSNVPEAYNRAAIISPIVVYVHHDVFLPETFDDDLLKALDRLPSNWGVLGVAGVKLVDGKKEIHGHILDRGKEWGSPWKLPAEVDTLDELLLITRGDLKFDENLEQDFYGADICMQARVRGQKCYAINAYCHHNSTRPFGERTESFYKSEQYFREKWKDYLPIATTCSIVSNV